MQREIGFGLKQRNVIGAEGSKPSLNQNLLIKQSVHVTGNKGALLLSLHNFQRLKFVGNLSSWLLIHLK